MDGHPWLRWLSLASGLAIIAVVLADVFLSVLYARVGTGLISHPLSCFTWRAFRAAGRWLGKRVGTHVLTFAGPSMLVLTVVAWFCLLVAGTGLVIWPGLGRSIVATSGQTPTDFITAMYIGGDAMTTVGAADMSPRTSFYRLFYTFDSFMGLSVLTLTLTFLVEIYTALQSRNTFAIKTHDATGDSAELLARLGHGGDFQHGYSQLAEMGAEMSHVEESHHFYGVIFYFRFHQPHYAATRVALVALDAAALIVTGMDQGRYGWLQHSAAVEQIHRASDRLLNELAKAFLPGGPPAPAEPSAADQARWRRRYFAALRRLREAGIPTTADERAGAEAYVARRAEWEPRLVALARHMAYEFEEIDPASHAPDRETEASGPSSQKPAPGRPLWRGLTVDEESPSERER